MKTKLLKCLKFLFCLCQIGAFLAIYIALKDHNETIERTVKTMSGTVNAMTGLNSRVKVIETKIFPKSKVKK